MTALAGVWRADGGGDIDRDCSRILSSQALYGPDSSTKWSDNAIALGRQLKRLLPEDAFDRQPLHGGNGRYALIADVRLDNREELARPLQIPSENTTGMSDADFLLASYERWGPDCVTHLIGDFAFVVWDDHERRLILARDPLGQRPLHYHRGKDIFAVASMPKGLHALPSIPYELDEESFLAGFTSAVASETRTVYRGIESVLPGHVVVVTQDSIVARRYWKPNINPIELPKTEDYVAALRAHLEEAVKCRLRGVNEVAVELSGGLDSTAVAATAAKLLAATNGRVIGFTAVPREGYNGAIPPNRFANEAPHAAATAALYPNMEHVLVYSEKKSPLDVLDRNFFLMDGPTSNLSNAVWTHEILSRAKERELNVLLHGSNGNLGLSYDGMELLAELFRSGHWLHLWREAHALLAQRKLRWRGVLVRTLGPWCPLPLWILAHRAFSRTNIDPTIYTPVNAKNLRDYKARHNMAEHDLNAYRKPSKDGREMRLSVLNMQDWGCSNKGYLGGWGIDSRDPTSDVRLLEFCLSIPTEKFLNNGVQRALARRALSDRLPKVVLDETRKGLQSADWHEVLSADRDRIRAELERLDSCPAAANLLNLPRMQGLVENWPEDGWDRAETISSYRGALMAALSVGHFVRRVTGSNA